MRQVEVQGVALQQQRAEKTDVAADLEDQARQFQLMQEKVSGLLQQLPGESEVPGLLEDIARLALANGLVIESVTPLDELSRPLYNEQPVQVGVTGAYHDLATFLSALGGLSRIATVHDVALRSDGKLLRLDLLAKSYWRSQKSVKRGAPALQEQPFVYDASGLRDPFQLLALHVDHSRGRAAVAPDLARSRGALEGLSVDQFDMVGTLSRGAQTSSCCARPLRCIAWRSAITSGRIMVESQRFMTAISSWSSCFPMNRAHGWSAREPSY